MRKISVWVVSNKNAVVFLVTLASVLFLHGAVPFVAVPTLGQAVWTAGFGQSFVNESMLTVHAHSFGVPKPAAIVFGLAGAYPVGLLIGLGLHPADAYAAMAAIWLTVAFIGAWRLGLLLGLPRSMASLAAGLWMSMPIVWAHSGYAMVSLGIALLPFYLWAAMRVMLRELVNEHDAIARGAFFLGVSLIAVFMDGYTYVMFAVGTALLGVFAALRILDLRRHLLLFALPVTTIGFGVAYILYTLYIGQPRFEPAPLDFFRGWGLDLTFLAIPTRGMHWFWDALGLSVTRSSRDFFGDASVWITTFSLPTIVAGLAGWWRTRKMARLSTGFLILAFFGLYMALGPSLKVASTRPEAMIEAGNMSELMPGEAAAVSTGSALLSKYVPGFQNMRAAYRWLALSLLGFWLLIVVGLGRLKSRRHLAYGMALVLVLAIFNLPHLAEKWQKDVAHREAFLRIDSELVMEMSSVLREGELIAFLPYRNDFLVNYLAPRLKIRTFNIGGDKNLIMAKEHWPQTMRQFRMGQVNIGFADGVLLLLARDEADAVVLPYIDMLWAAHAWPPPVKFRDDMAPIVEKLRACSFVNVEQQNYYGLVRIRPELQEKVHSGELERLLFRSRCIPPRCLEVKGGDLANLPRQVGCYDSGTVFSDGRKGFLVYGPYVYMTAGEYRLFVKGTASSTASGWVDVVSELGTVQHAKFPLSQTPEDTTGTLASGQVILDIPVDDLEARVYVGADDKVRLHGYELVPIGSDSTPSAQP